MILELIVLVGLLAALFVWNQFRYWTQRGIPQLQPSFPFGNLGEFIRQQNGIPMTYANLYAKSKHLPFVGIYMSIKPSLLVNDPQMVKNILTRDFEHFHDRGVHVNEETDPLSGNLFSLGGVKWKNLRAKLTPTFTSGCLKAMLPILAEKAMGLQNRFQKEVSSQESIDVKDLSTRYTTDVIASVAFGIDIDSINNEEELFRQMGAKIFKQDLQTSLRLAVALFMPRLKELLGFTMVAPDVEDFMINMVQKTLEQRERDGIHRKDMMQLLLQLRNAGTVSLNEDQWKLDTSNSAKSLTLNEVAAQAFVFFVAGYETSSTLMTFCLFELARNYEIQAKVHREIDSVLSRSGGSITYEGLAEMKYLESCLDETLRKHPPVPFLNRECTKTYRIPETDLTIEKGTSIIVSVLGLHRDPQYFPQPDEFLPDRFRREQPSQEKAYFPFGGGPRLCIGLRMGMLQTKVALVALLAKYRFSLADKEDYRREPPLEVKSMLMATRDAIRVVATER